MKSGRDHVQRNAFAIDAEVTTLSSIPQRFSALRALHRKGELLAWVHHCLAPRFLLRRGAAETPSTHRYIPLGAQHDPPLTDERNGRPFISNSIRTSRYTIYDFIPKQIVFQATRLSNFYFIVIGIPQAIPGFSTTGNYTTILPLVFFMLLTILKEGYDDLRRHRLDKKENNGLATRYGAQRAGNLLWITRLLSTLSSKLAPQEKHCNDGTWHSVRWRDLVVGDVVRIGRDQDFPADVVLLHTESTASVAYIETMALDGETNLKPRQAPTPLHAYDSLDAILAINCAITAEQPNRDLYNFNGRLSLAGKDFPLTSQEVIYRGCTLRNTAHAIGVVINTGEECKIRMNANHHPRAKKPRLESYANQIVLTLIVYVVLLSVGCSIGYLIFQAKTERNSWYLADAAVPFKQIIIGYGIMFNNVIPLALYVSLEIVKIGQMLMVSSDVEMFDGQSNSPMRCNTNTILENLGQVGFVLSDKTGTLTQNIMRFKGISVNGYAWSHSSARDNHSSIEYNHQPTVQDAQRQHDASKKGPSVQVSTIEEGTYSAVPAVDDSFAAFRQRSEAYGTTNALLQQISKHPASSVAARARDLIVAMAVCNTCLPEANEDSQIQYQAASPDELALVSAAQELGVCLTRRSTSSLSISVQDGVDKAAKVQYEVLDVIEFSSNRKRMSIILRCPNGRIWLICKGADNVLIPRLKHADIASRKSRDVKRSIDIERQKQRKSMQATRSTTRPSVTIERIRQSLEQGVDHISPVSPARQSLQLPEGSLDDSRQIDVYANCFQHIENFAVDGLRTLMFAHRYLSAEEYEAWHRRYREASTCLKDRQRRMEMVAEELEQSMDLLGATAIEDKLQTGVPDTIEKLRRANIRVWMLTGDKRETAINIAHSARICRPESNVFVLDAAKGNVEAQLQSAVDEVLVRRLDSVAVIDGHTLSVIESSRTLTKLFFSITPAISSVICCRASPAQKAFIVQAIHECVPRALTLAIGDGANDIAMIQAAHVGVGISGREGMQAARVADYSIAQFSFLQRLLLVHGRWNYVRTAKFVLWTFWKEMFFYMMQALFQQYTGYSGSSLYENWSLSTLR